MFKPFRRITDVRKRTTIIYEKVMLIPGLSRLRFVYQILFIIALMVIFLAVQGYCGMQIINKMQQTTQIVFNNNAKNIQDISNLINDLNQIQINYLTALTNPQKDPISIIKQQVSTRIDYLDAVDPGTRKMMKQKLALIADIVHAPLNNDNYGELQKNILAMKFALIEASKRIQNNGNEIIFNNNQFSDSAKQNTLIILFVSSLLAVFMGLSIAASVSRPLKGMLQVTKSLAIGDLTPKIDVSGNVEVGEMVHGLNQAIEGLRDLVKKINQEAEELFRAGMSLKNAAKETGLSATQVAKTMEELALAASEETSQINQAAETVANLANLVRKVTDETDNIAMTSKKVVHSAQLGQKVTCDATEGIEDLFVFTKEAATVIDELNNTSGEISGITNMIAEIAEKTTLLALNASIEAARAGEYGRGFSVVADETGKLADQSKQASDHISKMLLQMENRFAHAVNIMKQAIQKTKIEKNLVDEAATTFNEIFKSLEETLIQIDQVAKSAQQMAKSNEVAITAVNKIAAISEETMASTHEVSAAAEEQNALVEEVTALTEDLLMIAGVLRQSVIAFKIEQFKTEL